MNDDLLNKNASDDLRAYVVWVPMLGADNTDVAEATTVLHDRRATHYWDGSGWFVQAYRPVLGIREDVWDVYLVYGPDARWDGETPPEPDYWMHQLGTPGRPRVDGPYLDAGVFADKTAALLRASK